MSIIHEALKKVQIKMKKDDPKPEDIVEYLPSSNVNNPNKTKQSGLRSFLTIMVCLTVTGASIYLGYTQLKHQFPQLFSQKQLPNAKKISSQTLIRSIINPFLKLKDSSQQKSTTKTKPVVKSKPLPQTNLQVPENLNTNSTSTTNITTPSATSEITLQGIMSNATGNVALINNNVYEEGSVIQGGVKIIKINLQNISIEHNGKQEVIAVSKTLSIGQ